MNEKTIIDYWRQGHSKEWLIRKEKECLKKQAKTIEERKLIDWQATNNIETAMLNWYKREVQNDR